MMNRQISQAPIITTIIPTYRRPEMLRRAIRSVQVQSYPHFQVLVCDNASGDGTSEMVRQFSNDDPRVKYFCHPQNIGAISNFNFGMKRVDTPFFSLLSDDNIILPYFFEDSLSILKKNERAVFTAGQAIFQDSQQNELGSSLSGWREGLQACPDGLITMIEKRLPSWESVLFREEILHSIGNLDASYNGSADQDYLMRIARKYSFYVQRKPHAVIVQHPASWSSSRELTERILGWKRLMSQWQNDTGLTPNMAKRIDASIREKKMVCQLFSYRN